VRMLADRALEQGGRMEISFDGRGHNTPTATYSRAITNAGKRAWPEHPHSISAYSLRHAFAEDLKKSDLSRADISAALGHMVDKTASFYGHRGQPARGGHSVAPTKVLATTPVKATARTTADFKALRKAAAKKRKGTSLPAPMPQAA